MAWLWPANYTNNKNLDWRVICDKNNPKPSSDSRQHNLGSTDTTKGSPPFLTEAQLVNVFRRFDGNRDGRLSRKELRNAFESLGAYFPNYRAIMALYLADANGDGYISEAEMKDLIQYASSCGYYVQ